MTSPLYSEFEKRIFDKTQDILNRQVIPWSFLTAGPPFTVNYFDGRIISYQGVRFEGSPRLVFWTRYIEPFIEDLIINEIKEAGNKARLHYLDLPPLMSEIKTFFSRSVHSIFNKMAETDCNLRGRGFPQNVHMREVESDIENMMAFAERRIKDEVDVWTHESLLKLKTTTEDRTPKMPFSSLLTDTIDVLKSDGTIIQNLKASVQKTKVFLERPDILVESGDLIQRRLSNGATETFKVIDPGFYEAFHGIEAHYQMDVIKLGLPEAKQAVQSITFNITGHNARINQNSTDSSVNVVNIDNRVAHQITKLRQAISDSDLSDDEKNDASEITDEIERQFASGTPKKSIVSGLLKALPHIASIATIGVEIAKLVAS